MKHRNVRARNPQDAWRVMEAVEFTCGCGLQMIFSVDAVKRVGEATIVSGAIQDIVQKEYAMRAVAQDAGLELEELQ